MFYAESCVLVFIIFIPIKTDILEVVLVALCLETGRFYHILIINSLLNFMVLNAAFSTTVVSIAVWRI